MKKNKEYPHRCLHKNSMSRKIAGDGRDGEVRLSR